MTGPDATVFFLPGLGFGESSAAPFAAQLAAQLGHRFRVVGLDHPGNGGIPEAADGSVPALADSALSAIGREADGGPWLLVAHSMGGKVAGLVAARVLSGDANVFGLAGLVLLAPSPPTPEPMDDDKRALLLSWAENGALSDDDARAFIAQNVWAPLTEEAQQAAVAEVRRQSPLAWRRWLGDGSREDITASVGALDLPVVVIAGEGDVDLGASAQPGLLKNVYPRARFVSLPATGHLLPYEQPEAVAREIVALWEAAGTPRASADWGRLIASPRTGAEVRGLLARRALADDANYAPRVLSPAQLATLRELAEVLVPQSGDHRLDLAARVDADLADGGGDGWRPAGLPRDASAYAIALDALAPVWPGERAQQQELVRRILSGEAGELDVPWGEAGFRGWFDDVRTDLARTWTSHPATLARLGYDGFATSGERADHPGYVHIGAGHRDPWEPAELGESLPHNGSGTPE